jgi:hypothetical protein
MDGLAAELRQSSEISRYDSNFTVPAKPIFTGASVHCAEGWDNDATR